MTLNGAPSPKSPWQSVFTVRLAATGAEIGCLTLVLVLAGVFGGIWLDKIFGTKPLFILLLVLGSAPLSLVLTYFLAVRAAKQMTPPPTPGARANVRKEEESGE
jgi:F0F1-type ATP synthase assembly protein I